VSNIHLVDRAMVKDIRTKDLIFSFIYHFVVLHLRYLWMHLYVKSIDTNISKVLIGSQQIESVRQSAEPPDISLNRLINDSTDCFVVNVCSVSGHSKKYWQLMQLKASTHCYQPICLVWLPCLCPKLALQFCWSAKFCKMICLEKSTYLS